MKNCIVCNRIVKDGKSKFCCGGCEAVYAIVNKLALSGEERNKRIESLLKGVFPVQNSNQNLDEASQNNIIPNDDNKKELQFLLGGMVCPACAWLIHNSLKNQRGVSEVNVNFISEICSLSFNPVITSKIEIEKNVTSLGYSITTNTSSMQSFNYYKFGLGWFLTLNAMMISFVVYSAEKFEIPLVFQYICSYLLLFIGTITPLFATPHIIKLGFAQIKRFDFKMESLILLSTITAWIFSCFALITFNFSRLYFDIVCFILMLTETGNMISNGFYRKLSNRIMSIRFSLPKKVRLTKNNDLLDEYIDITKLNPNDTFEVLRNEVVPTDGIVLEAGEFDFSLITGESQGIHIKKGHFVGAGAKLLSDKIRLSVPENGTSSLIENLIESTIAAFNTKTNIPSMGDKISKVFVPSIFLIALCVFIFSTMYSNFANGILTFISVLIVACPCAFGIAEPLVLTLAINRARQFGIQIFNGNVLSIQPDTVIFDKTGTLTKGTFAIKTIKWFVEENSLDLSILSSLEKEIDHPLAKILSTLGDVVPITNKKKHEVKITGTYNGKTYVVGNIDSFKDVEIPKGCTNSTLVFFGDTEKCHLLIELEDELKDGIQNIIETIKKKGIHTAICSGDREGIVKKYAKELHIDTFYSSMRSEDKKELILKMQQNNEKIMMIGDGINDSQAITAADIGLSVFSGQIPTKMSSDGVFIINNITGLQDFLLLLKKVKNKIIANYSWAFIYNFIGIFLASFGKLSPTYCAIGMAFSNIVVILNSMYGYSNTKSNCKQ